MKSDKKARLSNPKRLVEYGIDDILSEMDLDGSETGADVGCGTGLFSFPIAKAIGNGKLICIDVNSEYIEYLKNAIKQSGLENMETVVADGYDTPIKEGSLDFVFMCVVLHEIPGKVDFLNAYRKKLKDSGRIFIVEFLSAKRSLDDDGLSDKAFLSENETKKYLQESGFADIKYKKLNELVYIMSAQNNI